MKDNSWLDRWLLLCSRFEFTLLMVNFCGQLFSFVGKKMYSPCWGYRLFWSWPPSLWNFSLISSTGRRVTVFSWKSQFLRSSKIKDNFFFFLIFSHCYDYNPAIQPRCNVVLGVISNESKEDDINRMLDVLTKVSQRVI